VSAVVGREPSEAARVDQVTLGWTRLPQWGACDPDPTPGLSEYCYVPYASTWTVSMDGWAYPRGVLF